MSDPNIHRVDGLTVGELTATVYEGSKGLLFIRLQERRSDSYDICIDAHEADALRDFLNLSLSPFLDSSAPQTSASQEPK